MSNISQKPYREKHPDLTHLNMTNEFPNFSKKYQTKIYNYFSDGIVQLDPAGRIVKVDRRILKFGEYQEDEIIGRNIIDLDMFSSESVRKISTSFSKILTKQKIPSLEVNFWTKSGKEKTVKIQSFLLMKKEKIVGIVSVLKDLTEQKMTEEKLRRSQKEKQVLIHELHHRVKNNMQIILSLLRLQLRKIEDKKLIETMNKWQNRLKSIAFIHEKFYAVDDLAHIDFCSIIQRLALSLFNAFIVKEDRIKLSISVGSIDLTINTAVPLGLIINELISNALLHAFPDGRKGEINISFTEINKQSYCLTIKDNGIGLPEDINLKDPQTLGFQLINALIDQIEGSMEVIRIKGTAINIRFEISI